MPAATQRVTTAAARRVIFGFGLREVGIAAVGLAILTAAAFRVRVQNRQNSEQVGAIRAQLAILADQADVYRQQITSLQAQAAQMRTWASAQTEEPPRTWARERIRRMDAMVAAVGHETEAREFQAGRKEVEHLCLDGDVAAAKAKLDKLPAPTFPPPSEFARLKHDLYDAPLADFSRQTPAYYRTFRQYEAAAAKDDETALRAEIQSEGEQVTPQLMLKVELLTAVAASDDPVVAEWSALTSAMDYFENPDGATLARWRRAQHALRINDWQTVTSEMQAILISKVRTRQPFRAAYGRALIKSRPSDPAAAYPYMAEAAAAGDKQARSWAADEDMRQRRYTQAQRWLEAAVADGDVDAAPRLVELYEKGAGDPDPTRQAGVLQRIADRVDTSPDALIYLGRLYESGDPPGSTKAKAFACYARAADKGSATGLAEVARCAMRGVGTPQNLDQAVAAASQAYSGGQREPAAGVLLEALRRAPERAASRIQAMFDQESVNQGGGYAEKRDIDGPGVSQLKVALARYLDSVGQLGRAARLYAGAKDASASKRGAELSAVHPCETCGGTGKISVQAPCPTCGGKGRQVCGSCGGTGFIYVPGIPPCPTCGGTGTMVQDRRVVACSTCGGTGKGKGNVLKQDCTHCDHGYVPCPDCTNGMITVKQECPDCHGRGSWTLIDRAGD